MFKKITPKEYDEYIDVLSRLADTVSEMSMDYRVNPWYGANIKSLTYELRHDISTGSARLIDSLNKLNSMLESASSELSICPDFTIENLSSISDILEIGSQSKKVPLPWLTGELSINSLKSEADKCEQFQIDYKAERDEVLNLYKEILNTGEEADFTNLNTQERIFPTPKL